MSWPFVEQGTAMTTSFIDKEDNSDVTCCIVKVDPHHEKRCPVCIEMRKMRKELQTMKKENAMLTNELREAQYALDNMRNESRGMIRKYVQYILDAGNQVFDELDQSNEDTCTNKSIGSEIRRMVKKRTYSGMETRSSTPQTEVNRATTSTPPRYAHKKPFRVTKKIDILNDKESEKSSFVKISANNVLQVFDKNIDQQCIPIETTVSFKHRRSWFTSKPGDNIIDIGVKVHVFFDDNTGNKLGVFRPYIIEEIKTKKIPNNASCVQYVVNKSERPVYLTAKNRISTIRFGT